MSQARVRFYINSRNSFINLLVIVLLLLLNYHIIILNDYYFVLSFLATICKTVRPMLSDRCPVCPVCLSVMLCTVAKRWMDQDETWHGRIRLGPGDIVLHGDPAPHGMGHVSPLLFGPLRSGTVAHLSNCWALVEICEHTEWHAHHNTSHPCEYYFFNTSLQLSMCSS